MLGVTWREIELEDLQKLCSYATAYGRCPYGKVTLIKGGVRYPSAFCKVHCCIKIDQAACQDMRTSSNGFCRRHLQCTGQLNGQQSPYYVKRYEPREYAFCSQYHNCNHTDCRNERSYTGDADLKYCSEHRCSIAGCTHPREGPGLFCEGHTCEAPNCLAPVPGGGDPGQPTRYCERHCICQESHCQRFAHVRASGSLSLHCGAHYCHWEGCDKARESEAGSGAEHCKEHTCIEPGCAKGKTKADGYFCKNHECETKECRFRRWLGDFCPAHQCGKPGCDKEATTNHYCELHLTCSLVGCNRFRMVVGGTVLDRCEERELPAYSSPTSVRDAECRSAKPERLTIRTFASATSANFRIAAVRGRYSELSAICISAAS
ncbi:hypothetical protein SODALDRAFT_266365 [Sodiomyces alkalinus F11]|uniref:Uncharacterized protein n=1 Tax=Sodiomyces alkalinus (strain CBS 110278 / VKM F-3762 / F11) TaxID=1314773 RepID=A0A3N2Q9M7_SODAK|nr:hypothetical protein SODALDRAFT_266365 [Sodiomyces alkalinus F11]ROT43461.1 hypothetical protein SODALDRAFT_266365 [Sodiomyces alkalinus F11]